MSSSKRKWSAGTLHLLTCNLVPQLYRLERYQECYESYLELIKNSEDEYEDERETNLAAVVACMVRKDPKAYKEVSLGDQTFELCYNKACIEINKGNYSQAITKLTETEGKIPYFLFALLDRFHFLFRILPKDFGGRRTCRWWNRSRTGYNQSPAGIRKSDVG